MIKRIDTIGRAEQAIAGFRAAFPERPASWPYIAIEQGRIAVIRLTNHRVRLLTILERQ